MAFLEADAKNVASGWGPEPKLEAPNIGTTLAAILTNRRLQQQQTQDTLSAAIKAQQDRNQASAYGRALQSAGVVPGGVDLSNMSGPDLSKLAAMYQETIPDTDVDALHQAMTKYYNARADDVNDPDAGTPDPAEQRRQDAEKRREISDQIKASQGQMKLASLPPNAVPHALSPGETVTPGTYPFDVGGKLQNIPQGQVDKFNAARRVYDTLTTQQAGIAPPAGSTPPPGSAGGGDPSGQYPVGTHARQGSVWFVKQNPTPTNPSGWVPDPNFSQ